MTPQYTDEQVLANRRKWIEFLRQPGRQKARSFLDVGHGARCCLGHGCYALGIARKRTPEGFAYGEVQDEEMAPAEFVQAVGLWDRAGSSDDGYLQILRVGADGPLVYRLTGLNDDTDWTPRQIGDYLESVVLGGDRTPFRPISLEREG
jgi:hypothetical protein